MLAKRIIPCLDIKNGRTVKGIRFTGLADMGDPVEMAKIYSDEGADELVFLDIGATVEERKTFAGLVERIAAQINIPFTVGGGISGIEDAALLLQAGADKVSVNSAAVLNPQLVTDISKLYGSQFVVAAIDARLIAGRWTVTTHAGTRPADKELFSWALELQERGAGEILFTSMDHDGTKNGYACSAYKQLSRILSIPVIASGGAGNAEHFARVLSEEGGTNAALAASVFHYGEIRIPQLKSSLLRRGIPVRPLGDLQGRHTPKL